MQEMLIGSVDIGIRNLAFCIYDTETASVKHLELIDLLKIPGTSKRLPFGDQSIVFLVKRAIKSRMELFQSLDCFCVEKQMTRKMVLLAFAFEAVLDEACTVLQISPRAVKTMFGTSRGNHANNKQAAIMRMYSLLDAKGVDQLNQFTKKDDVCDAILQAMYTAEHYDELVAKKIKLCTVQKKKKRRKRKRPDATSKKSKKTFFIDRNKG